MKIRGKFSFLILKIMTKITTFNQDYRKVISHDSSGYVYYCGAKCNFGVYKSPFYNCQNFSIASFHSFLDYFKDVPKNELITFIKGTLGEGRKLLIVDINQIYSEIVEDLFEGYEFIVNQPYESTNGSEMNLFYIKLVK